jgi:hypothetical protein
MMLVALEAARGSAAVLIGQIVIYGGREYRIRGFTPAGVIPATVDIESVATGEVRTVPVEALRARLRLVGTDVDENDEDASLSWPSPA